jgi:predicted enzyme related to lactoylglutathione lyase
MEMTPKKHHPFAWIEIPVRDMRRTVLFFETVFQLPLKLVDFGELQMAWFPNAGVKLIQPKTQIAPEYGYMVVINDAEGNRIALYTAN